VRVVDLQVDKEGDLWTVRHGIGEYHFRTRELAMSPAKKAAREIGKGEAQVKILVQDRHVQWQAEKGV
jgi:hypothetical protein